MTAETIPEWAMKKAEEARLAGLDGLTRRSRIEAIARALAETAERVERETREADAQIADQEEARMADLAKTHPENSAERDRCWARARSCANIATAIRSLPAKYGAKT